MSAKLKRNVPMLELLANSKPALRKQIVKAAPDEVVDCVAECCHNLLKGHIDLSKSEKSKLARHKQILRQLANKKISRKRKRLSMQRGGFIPLLGTFIKTALPVIASLFSGR